MSTPTFELDRSPAAFIATLEVDSPMMQAPNGDGFGLVSAVGVRIGDFSSSEIVAKTGAKAGQGKGGTGQRRDRQRRDRRSNHHRVSIP